MDLYCLKGKSGNMLQFKKSSNPDFSNYTIVHKLDLLLKEQLEQRKDLSIINALLKSMLADRGIQKQVDDFYTEEEPVHPEDRKDLD